MYVRHGRSDRGVYQGVYMHSKNSFTCNYLLAVIVILQVSK